MVLMHSTANADIVLEVGATFIDGESTDSATIILQKRWQDRFVLGLGYLSAQYVDTCGRPDCEWDISSQWMVGGEYMLSWRRVSFGVGLYYVENLSRITSSYLNVRSSLEFAITQRFAVKYSHISNGGIGKTITICNDFYCLPSGKYNLGVDAILLVWQF